MISPEMMQVISWGVGILVTLGGLIKGGMLLIDKQTERALSDRRLSLEADEKKAKIELEQASAAWKRLQDVLNEYNKDRERLNREMAELKQEIKDCREECAQHMEELSKERSARQKLEDKVASLGQ